MVVGNYKVTKMTFKLANNIIQVNENDRQQPSIDENTVNVPLSKLIENPVNTEFDENNQNVIQTIDVAVDMLQRLYSGIYILNQTVSRTSGLEEHAAIFEELLRTKLIEPLSNVFPDLTMFDAKVTYINDYHRDAPQLVLTGRNTFTSTILHALQTSLRSPVAEKTAFLLDELDEE
jgi:hypothetical protein